MSENKFTPGPWKVTQWMDVFPVSPQNSPAIATLANKSGFMRNAQANAHLIAAAPKLLEALLLYQNAHCLPSVGDYAAMDYSRPNNTFDKSYGGGDCEKHGRYYGARCEACETDLRLARKRADETAAHVRNVALRQAFEFAREAIREARGE